MDRRYRDCRLLARGDRSSPNEGDRSPKSYGSAGRRGASRTSDRYFTDVLLPLAQRPASQKLPSPQSRSVLHDVDLASSSAADSP